MKKRYYGIFLDPVLACNLRCRMCYFSDDNRRKELRGKLSQEDIKLIADRFFPYALKLQIGCGAEPTMFNNLSEIISLAKKYSVPYISMTTNANLLQKDDLRQYAALGLNEITVSLHGVKQSTYEYLMENGSFDKFTQAMSYITELKKEFKDFKLRINYTVNSDNCLELANFFDVLGQYTIDILQLRPVQKIGQSKYSDFSWQTIIDNYDATLGKLKDECKKRNITLICPDKADLTKQTNNESIVLDYTYVYISPQEIFNKDFFLQKDTYHSYCKKHGFAKEILKRIFSKNLNSSVNTKLNYNVS